MKIFLPFQIKNIGGTATFVQKFSHALRSDGFIVSHDYSKDFDILFIIADCSLLAALSAKWRKKAIIQRLDGVYNHATTQTRWYWIYNIKMFIIYRFFSDYIIFQSNFSKLSCERFLGKVRVPYQYIYNGVDLSLFTPSSSPTPALPVRLITFAKFRRKDQIVPLLEAVKLLPAHNFTLDIFGEFIPSLAKYFNNLPQNIHFRGKRENATLAETIPSYSLFLFSDQSACPNSVIEALACGLPVVAYNRGSISEIITSSKNGEVIPLKDHDPFKDPFPFDPDSYTKMAQAIKDISANLFSYRNAARETAQRQFDLKDMIEKYKESFRINLTSL